MKVAVVGGGLFGVTCAIELGRLGMQVDLWEKNEELLMAASGVNQFRLHRGYHYPRALSTALSSRDSVKSFQEEYQESVQTDFEHYYAIAKEKSLTSPQAYLAFCDRARLPYKPEIPKDWIGAGALSLCLKVEEDLIDPKVLKQLCLKKLQQARVQLRLQESATPTSLKNYDWTILATYASLNELVPTAEQDKRVYQFELVEKPVVRLPKIFDRKSAVILDGPFMCLDPYGGSGHFLLGNVVEAIHQTQVGLSFKVPAPYADCVNQGVVSNSPLSRFNRFIETARTFFPPIEAAEHVGSLFTVRVVLPDRDDTDERPTIVQQVSDRTITVFSGKLGTCVHAARQVSKLIREQGAVSKSLVTEKVRA